MVAFQKAMEKFGVVELVRTGRISLKRGEKVFRGEHDELEYQLAAAQVAAASASTAKLAPMEQSMEGDVYRWVGRGPLGHVPWSCLGCPDWLGGPDGADALASPLAPLVLLLVAAAPRRPCWMPPTAEM